MPLFLTLASASASSRRFLLGLDPLPVGSRTSINRVCLPLPLTSSCCRFQISVDHPYVPSLLSHSQALHLHPFAGLHRSRTQTTQTKPDQTEPNQSAPQRNSIPIRYLDLPKAASTAILPRLQPPQSAIKQYSPNVFAFPRLIILILTYSPRHLVGLYFLRSATPPLPYRSRAHPPANRALPLDRLHFTLTQTSSCRGAFVRNNGCCRNY